MTLTAALLGLLAVWSLDQLVTRDALTAGPRLALRRWARARRHRPGPILPTAPYGRDRRQTCHCGMWFMNGAELWDHITEERAAKPTWLYKMITCPWCISFYLAIPVGATAYYWGDTPAWQIAVFPFAARIVAGAAVVHLGPEADDNEDIADDRPAAP